MTRTFVCLIAAVILGVDVVTKAIVSTGMALNQSVPVIGEWVRLTYVRNPGVAFSLFPGRRTAFIILSLTGLTVVATYLVRHAPRTIRDGVAIGLFLGGALGNLVDRVRTGEVVDFIEIGVRTHRFPVFNVADMGVTFGVALLVLSTMFPPRAPAPAVETSSLGDLAHDPPVDPDPAGGIR